MQLNHITRGLAISLASATAAWAQVDSAQIMLTQAQATGTTDPINVPGLLNAVGYDSATDTMFTSAILPSDPTIRIRRINNVSTSPTITNVITSTQLNAWLQRGEARTGTGNPSGLTFNPAAVGTIPTAGSLWFTDTASISQVGSTTNDPAASLRVYRWNLQDVPTSFPTDFENMSQVMTALASKADKQIAAGIAPGPGSDSNSRQSVFSPDANWLYLLDSGPATGIPGIYRISPTAAGTVVKLTTPVTTSTASEPAVMKNGSLDRIYYRSANNPNGLSYVDHDPIANTTSPETVALSAAQLQDFLETTETVTIPYLTNDANGNLYFWATSAPTSTGLGVMIKLDGAGRMVKVTNRVERANILGLPPTGSGAAATPPFTARLSTHTYNHPTAGAITRVVGSETLVGVTAGIVFKPYDFDRDGDEDSTDINAFKGKLTLRGVVSPIADARYDLNGNSTIDWKDVKILQSFAGFLDGDANMDGTPDIADFAVLAGNFNQGMMIWTQGDFTGDETVGIADFALLASNFNVQALQRGGLVPEPSAAMLTVLASWGLALRRRRSE